MDLTAVKGRTLLGHAGQIRHLLKELYSACCKHLSKISVTHERHYWES